MKKSVIRWLAILAAIFVGYHIVVFALPLPKAPVFWLSYIFTLIAMAVQVYVIHTAFYHGEGIKSKFYGFPIAKIGVCYFVVQLVLGILFMAIGTLTPTWVPLILYAVLFCAAVIGLVAADAAREEVEHQDVKLEKNVSTMRELRAKVDSIASQAKDSDVSQALEKLAEEFRFSDPVSDFSLTEIEAELSLYIDDLRIVIRDHDKTAILSHIQKIRETLMKRNQLCKLSK